jgi:hypothetical protein
LGPDLKRKTNMSDHTTTAELYGYVNRALPDIELERGFHQAGDVENRLGYYVGQLGR